MSDFFVDNYLDEYEVYNMDQHKFVHNGHSGKGRTKREASQHSNSYDPQGHTRKTVQKLVNNKNKQNDRD